MVTKYSLVMVVNFLLIIISLYALHTGGMMRKRKAIWCSQIHV